MSMYVGAHRSGVPEFLLSRFDDACAGNGPIVVTLEAPLGMGKTRIIQELYARLARDRQPGLPYWPEAMTDDVDHVLTERKRVTPERFVAPGGATLPWLWWAIDCHISDLGSPMQSLQQAGPQLEAHAQAIQSEVAKKAERREDATMAVDAMFDLLGVVNPGAALDAAQKGWTLWRRRRDRRTKAKELQADRVIDPDARSQQLAVELARSVRELSAVVPIVLVIDDAQWADPALVSLLRHAGELSDARLLIVSCVWPEALVRTRGTGTFGSWLSIFESVHPDRLARIRLDPLERSDLVSLVLDAAPRTSPEIAGSIADLASGNPLTLALILDLDRVRRDIAEDGRIDLDPGKLAGLPRDVEALYQALWRQLPGPSRRVLAALSLQGPQYTVGWLEGFATSIGQYEELTHAYQEVLALESWVRVREAPFHDFAELARYRVAFDNVQQVLSDEEQVGVYRATTANLRALQRAPGWLATPADERRTVLTQYLEQTERLGDGEPRDLEANVTASLELAELELDASRAERAIELTRGALRVVPSGAGALAARAKRLLANALAAAGRGAEAIPLLEEAAIADPSTDDPRDLEAAAEVAGTGLAAADGLGTSSTGEVTLQAWEPWPERPLAPLTSMPASEVGALIAEVVAAEGPVLFGRVMFSLRSASGASRAGGAIRNSLERGLSAAVVAGTVVVSAPDASGDSWRRTLRAPGQRTAVRVLTPRNTWDVPPDELEVLARWILAEAGEATDRDSVKRRIAELYRWKRYTAQLDELLESILPGDIGRRSAAAVADFSEHGPADGEAAASVREPPERAEVELLLWDPWPERAVESLVSLPAQEVAALVAEVVSVEGPMLVNRIIHLLRAASGASRAGAAIRNAVEAGLLKAVEAGEVIVSAADASGESGRRTVRRPGQPTLLRVLGPRNTWDVPPEELEALARRLLASGEAADRTAVKRRMAKLYGWARYTDPLDELLESILPADIT